MQERGNGSDLNLTILQAHVPAVTTTYKVVATIAGCSSVDLTDRPTVSVDNDAPYFTSCPSNIQSVDAGFCTARISWIAPVVNDNCGTAPTVIRSGSAGVTFVNDTQADVSVGTSTITYTATDAAGHQSTCSFTITINDDIAPLITCPASVSVSGFGNIPAPMTRANFGLNISDNCSVNDNSLVAP